jgi:pectate lyase
VYQFDIYVALLHLESITDYHGDVVDSVTFSYMGWGMRRHTTGPWGGTGGGVTTVSSTTLLASYASNTNNYTLLADI